MSSERPLRAGPGVQERKWRGTRNWVMAAIILLPQVLPFAAEAQASNTPEPLSSPGSMKSSAGQSVRVTTQYIDAKLSLDYPGFEGLSVDSLGREHFPLVIIDPPARPWLPTQAKHRGSRVEYRGAGISSSKPARWTIRLKGKKSCLFPVG